MNDVAPEAHTWQLGTPSSHSDSPVTKPQNHHIYMILRSKTDLLEVSLFDRTVSYPGCATAGPSTQQQKAQSSDFGVLSSLHTQSPTSNTTEKWSTSLIAQRKAHETGCAFPMSCLHEHCHRNVKRVFETQITKCTIFSCDDVSKDHCSVQYM